MKERLFRMGVIAPLGLEFRQIAHLQSEAILIRRAGVGPANGASAAQSLIDEGCGLIVSWGFCGALGNLRVGDVVRAGRVIDASTNEQFQSSFSLPDTVISTHYVADGETKRHLADSGAVAVDMESASIARVCQVQEIAFAVLRVVVDDREANWPRLFERFSGASALRRLALGTRHPVVLSIALLNIYRGTLALKKLSVELEDFLEPACT